MPSGQPLPLLWLLSDARNDARLEDALARLPRGSGFVFRHYHLDPAARRGRFDALVKRAREGGHVVILSGEGPQAQEWSADGIYGPVDRIGPTTGLLRLATAHNEDELQAANAAHVDGVFLSPVFATRSHRDAEPLGADGFRTLARRSAAPVIALGGMSAARARELDWPRWGAIDGLA